VGVRAEPDADSAVGGNPVGWSCDFETSLIARDNSHCPSTLSPQGCVVSEVALHCCEEFTVASGGETLRRLNTSEVVTVGRLVDESVSSDDYRVDDRQDGDNTVVVLDNSVDDASKNVCGHPRPRNVVNENDVDSRHGGHCAPHARSAGVSARDNNCRDANVVGTGTDIIEVGFGCSDHNLVNIEFTNDT
jgi:hypothetical protein